MKGMKTENRQYRKIMNLRNFVGWPNDRLARQLGLKLCREHRGLDSWMICVAVVTRTIDSVLDRERE